MRIKLQGRHHLSALKIELAMLVDELSSMGVEEVQNLNIYFNPLAQGRHASIYGPGDERVDMLTVTERRAFAYTVVDARDLSAGSAEK